MTKAKWIGALGAALTMCVAPAAFADGMGSGQGGYGSVGLLLGAATQSYTTFGIGARGGYTLPMNIYLGATLGYNFGSSPAPNVSFHSFMFGVEGGYDLTVGPVVIRPYLGLGDLIASASVPSVTVAGFGTVGGGSVSSGNFALWPGATVMYPISNFFVGGDLKLLIVPGADEDAVGLGVYATGGMTF
jgi:hypothetical protein